VTVTMHSMTYAFQCGRLAAMSLVACLLAACGGGGGGSTPSAPPAPVPITSINLTSAWNDSNVALTAGETVTITASGTFNSGLCAATLPHCNTSPSGDPWATCSNVPPPAFIAPGLPCYSLVGKIGATGTPFEVGTSLQFTAATAGELYLSVNDNYFPDNSGSWTVNITT
jgi:hypothetical protein